MILKVLLAVSLAFSALAFGSSELWAIATTEILILWTACICLVKPIKQGHSLSQDQTLTFPSSSFRRKPESSSFKSPSFIIIYMTAVVFLILVVSRLPYSFYPYGTKIRLIQILSLIAMFFIVTNTYARQQNLQRLVTTLVCIGFAVSLLAIIQKLSGTDKMLWFRELSSRRAALSFYGPFVNRNTFAAYIGLIIPLAASVVMIQTDVPQKIFYSFITATLLASQLFSLSRGGIVSTLAAIILFAAFSFRITKSRLAKISSLICTGALAVVLAAWVGFDPIFNRLKSIGNVQVEASYYMRFSAWKDTVKIVQDHIWFGTGLGSFPEIFTRYQTSHKEFAFQHAHNDYLELLSEAGVTGFTVIFAGFVFWFRMSWVKLWQRHDKTAKYIGLGGFTSIFSVVMHSLVDFPLQNYAVLVLLMCVIAMTTLAVNRYSAVPLQLAPECLNRGSFQQAVSGNPVPLNSGSRHVYNSNATQKIFIAVIIITSLAVTPYMVRSGIGSACFALVRIAANKNESSSRAVLYLNRAIYNDLDNAAYHFELAKRYLSLGHNGYIDKSVSLALAKRSLRTAAILSPHNATYNQR